MSFLKNIFSRDQKNQDIPDLENEIPIYIKKGIITQNSLFKIRIPPNNSDPKLEQELLSVEIILQTQSESLQNLINQVYQNTPLSEFCLALYDDNSPNTYIKLKPSSIPYNLMNKTDKKLFLIPLKKTKTFSDISSSYLTMEYYLPHSKQGTLSPNRKNILMSGELLSYNHSKNTFNKKQLELTEDHIITPNNKTKIVDIDQIKEISFNLAEVPQEIAKGLKHKRNVITIKFYNGNMNIYHSKKTHEYEKWKKYFDYVFLKKEERIRELQITGTIQKLNQNIYNTFEIIINNLLDNWNFDEFMSFNGSRKAFYGSAKNQVNLKLIEAIISYKNFIREKKFFNAWCEMQRFISYAKMMKNNQTNIISDETKEQYSQKLSELALEVQNKSEKSFNNQQELFENFGNLMPYDFLDETYQKIKNNGMIDEFKKCLERSIIQLKKKSSNSKNWEEFGMYEEEIQDEKVNVRKRKGSFKLYTNNLIENLTLIFVVFYLNIHDFNGNKFALIEQLKMK